MGEKPRVTWAFLTCSLKLTVDLPTRTGGEVKLYWTLLIRMLAHVEV